MIKFFKGTYEQCQLIWLRERIQSFIALNAHYGWTIDEFIQHFLEINQNQNYNIVKKIMEEYLK